MSKIGDLRKILREQQAEWTVNEKYNDTDEIPQFPLGVIEENVPLANQVNELDLQSILSEGTNNLFLIKRRTEEGFTQPISDLEKISKVINPENSNIINLEELNQGSVNNKKTKHSEE